MKLPKNENITRNSAILFACCWVCFFLHALQESSGAASSGRGLAVEDSPLVTYPRELPSDPKESFLAMHEFLAKELVDDVADNVSVD